MTSREDLIEKAAKAICDANPHEVHWNSAVDHARAALAVFEQENTPITDEREALDYLNEMNEAGRIEYDDYRNLHDLISGAVEPAPEMFPGTLAALDDLTTLPKKGQE